MAEAKRDTERHRETQRDAERAVSARRCACSADCACAAPLLKSPGCLVVLVWAGLRSGGVVWEAARGGNELDAPDTHQPPGKY